MAIETERRFLLSTDNWRQDVILANHITQGYLSDDPERIVRVRIKDHDATITIKGLKEQGSGLEFEYSISKSDAHEMIKLCKNVLVKTRYVVEVNYVMPTWHSGVHRAVELWEIDEFHGDNTGLIIAEIEFDKELGIFSKPGWLGDEITDDVRYANSNLAQYPYNTWNKLFV